MPNLNMTSATYADSVTTGFGQALTGGYGATATKDVIPLGSSFCIEALVSMSAVPAAIKICAAQYKVFSLGVNTSGYPYATYGSGNTRVTLLGSSNICDGTERWLTLEVDQAGGGKLYVGTPGGGAAALVASNSLTPQQAGASYVIAMGSPGVAMDIGSFRSSGATTNDWTVGTISEVAVWMATRSVSSVYTPPTVPYVGTERNLKALWHLDGGGIDSKGNATADGYTVVAPALIAYDVASQLSVIANDYLTAAVTVTIAATGNGSGSLSSPTVTLPAGAPVRQHVTYTPSGANGVRKFTFTNNGGLTNPSPRDAAVVNATSRFLPNDANILYSPYNWLTSATSGKTVNAGAYFRTIFNGTYAELEFDTSVSAGPLPMLAIRVDGGAWVRKRMASAVPVDVDPGNSNFYHLLEVVVDATTQKSAGVSRWSGSQQAGVVFKSLKISGADLRAPQRRDKNAILYADSIGEGVNALSMGQSNAPVDDIVCNTAVGTWAFELGARLNAEIGIVAFGAQGFSVGGSLGVPSLAGAYNLMWSGQARDFATYTIDYAFIAHGTNDSTNNTQPNGLTTVNGLLAASTKAMVFVIRPFGGGSSQVTNLKAIVAGCSDPMRVRYIDTAGFWSSGDSFDSVHPLSFAQMGGVLPKVLTAVMNRGIKSARTITSTVVDSSGQPRTNLNDLKWTYFDKPNPGAFDIISDSGTGATTDSNGVITLAVNSVQDAGATGWLVLSDSNGTTTQSPAPKSFCAPVVLT